MLLQEKDHEAFKRWVLPKLETISEADAEVLADYVIALVLGQESEVNVRRDCLASLSDFLQDYTESFVNDVIQALHDKSYLEATTKNAKANGTPTQNAATGAAHVSSHSAPIPSIVGSSNTEYEPHILYSVNTPPAGAPKGPAATRATTGSQAPRTQNVQLYASGSSRKRKLVERESDPSQDGRDPYQDRNSGNKKLMKQAARRTGARGPGTESQNNFASFSAMANMHNLPPPPPGPPPFDPSDPMAMFAMAAAFGIDLSGMPPLPFAMPQGNTQSQQDPKAKCKDYHTKGYCVLGSVCPYEHGNAIAVPADKIPAYDPEHASLALQPGEQDTDGQKGHSVHRGRSRNNRGGQGRADFTHIGPSHDPSNTTLVVDKIPEENCSEDEVRRFFSAFGEITDVKMQTYKRMAVIKFQDREAAQRAYHSPKAVFENRFVRVFWHKTHLDSPRENGDVDMEPEEERESPEEIAKRQAEAQKAFEERRRKTEEAEARSAEIDRLLKEKTEEMRKIRRQLAELSGDKEEEEEGFTQTLASLQAEAEDLFAQYEPEAVPSSRGRGAHRGGYRGRGYSSFPPRGRGHAAAIRGAHRGRGANFAALHGRTSVKRLDNRPRRLAVADVEEHSAKDEALRQHLINIPDCTSIERHPEQPASLILTFNERYQAEMFLDESRNLSGVGKLDFAWVPNDAFGGVKTAARVEDADVSDGESSATVGEDEVKPETEGGVVKIEQDDEAEDADMDVADDVDQWL
ncbi:hypothetical protein T440DRAFT_499643 [Plenodomus tracheiphilus IPT5]|uniref:RNA-binding domain-containing protein n=1 Tax=Plenodomus tracheiphilus IPT5 TaxID=1408161 RepID=A0A6A7B516_9PLEO|nr:hypothetical protein T440DRAFT_499643 [Plenodomus tracheiphilus IPT5]